MLCMFLFTVFFPSEHSNDLLSSTFSRVMFAYFFLLIISSHVTPKGIKQVWRWYRHWHVEAKWIENDCAIKKNIFKTKIRLYLQCTQNWFVNANPPPLSTIASSASMTWVFYYSPGYISTNCLTCCLTELSCFFLLNVYLNVFFFGHLCLVNCFLLHQEMLHLPFLGSTLWFCVCLMFYSWFLVSVLRSNFLNFPFSSVSSLLSIHT